MLPSLFKMGIPLGFLLILCTSVLSVAANESRADRLQCWHCEGEGCEDPVPKDCAADLQDDHCYSLFDSYNDLVGMGCLSDFGTQDEIVQLTKQKLLFKCDGANCNDYNNWPGTNICTRCSSANDLDCVFGPERVTTTETCSQTPYTHCYERVNKATGATERGCLYDLENEDFYACLTDEKGEGCSVCLGANCNRGIVPATRAQCHRCDSTSDARCEAAPRSLSVCPTYVANDMCVSFYENDVVRRGCASELSCDGNAKNCDKCRGEGCNTVNIKQRSKEVYGMFQELPLNCNTCDGVDDCKTGIFKPRKCEGDKYQDCMSVFNNERQLLRRGCENDVVPVYAEHCDKYPELCFKCKSNGCNNIVTPDNYQECLYCDAKSNPDCLFKPESIETTRKCVEGCLSSLYPRSDDPTVYDFVRACAEDIENDDREICAQAKNCESCKDSNECNTAILPAEGRLSCLYCDGADCNQPQSRQCVSYSADDQCYMFFDNVTNSAIRAGCVSDLQRRDVQADIKQYFLCDGDNCNSFSNLPDARMCFECNSATDENCAINPLAATLRRCQITPYTDCYTRVLPNGHTERGCLQSLPIDDFVECTDGDDSPKCQKCSESRCNGVIFPSGRQSCYRCDSSVDASCQTSPSQAQVCPVYKAQDSCVTKLVGETTLRGCGSELDCSDSNAKNCVSCTGDNCNNVNLVVEDIGPPGLFQGLPLNCYHCGDDVDCWVSKGQLKKCEGNNLQTCTVAFGANGNVVQRGCSDLVESTCMKAGNSCYDCKSNGCNTAERTTDYIDCLFCDAQQNSNCVFNVSGVTRTRKCQSGCITALYPRNKDDKKPVHELTRTCWDDLDLDDREACLEGTLETCKACTTPNCNTADVGERLSCYQCEGENCQDPQIHECRGVLERDQCIIEFDETSSVALLGCKSRYDEAELELRIREQRLWICEGANCNTLDALPSSQRCSLCSSLTDEKCAISPSEVTTSTLCAQVPTTQCYSRILKSGHTERGCASSLVGDDYYDCYMGSNANCTICSGASCNVQVFPQARRSCHVCNSQTDATCKNSPNSPQVCLLYSPNEQCVTSIEVDTVKRGCSSQLKCDASDAENCRLCDGDNCNNDNVVVEDIGPPGLFQGLPLNCYHCDNDVDCWISKGQIKKCEGNNLQTCTVAFNATGGVAQRGCSDAVKSTCRESGINCYECKSNGCNTAERTSDFIDCLFCDAQQDPDCVFNVNAITRTRKCQSGCITALYPRNKNDSHPVHELTRTCWDDLDLDDREACLEGTLETCKACTTPNCNTADVGDRLSCYHCSGENCQDPQPQQCRGVLANDQCIIEFDETNSISALGCKSQYDEDELKLRISEQRLWICEGANCNTIDALPSAQPCALCSSLTDSNCAISPNQVTSSTNCAKVPVTQCYTRVLKSGHTERGCASSLVGDDYYDCYAGSNGNCTICSGASCNVQLFPQARRSCHVCNSQTSEACETTPNTPQVCLLYSPNEQCVTSIDEYDTVRRGCSSQLTCDVSDTENCRVCDSDNCNKLNIRRQADGKPGLWQALPLSCHTCDNEAACNTAPIPTTTCGDNDYCMTVFGENGKVEMRGCSSTVDAVKGEYCDQDSDKCSNCNSNDCNNAFSLDDFVECVYCDSITNKNCVLQPNEVTKTRRCQKQCMTALWQRPNSTAYELVRSCLDDKDKADQEACSGDKCRACSGTKCNTDMLPENRLSCYKCDNCEDFEPQVCSGYREDDQCYLLFEENDITRMGCLSDLDDAYLNANINKMFTCKDNLCNEPSNLPQPQVCVVCNSFTDDDCAVDATKVPSVTTCATLPNTHCYTKVDTNGQTLRGCVSDLSDSESSSCLAGSSATCKACTGDRCNIEVFPATRRTCHRCNSKEDPSCARSPNAVSACPRYVENDGCSAKLVNGYVYRGCSSEFTCDDEDKQYCRNCANKNNCNTVDLESLVIGYPGRWDTPPISCYKCIDSECSNNNLGSLTQCKAENEYQNCATVFDGNNNIIQRGCSDDIYNGKYGQWCDEQAGKCQFCKSGACNSATSINDYVDCIACDGKGNAECALNPTPALGTRRCHKSCFSALYPRRNETNPAHEMDRNCLDDLPVDLQAKCGTSDMPNCRKCDGNNCNTAAVPATRKTCFFCPDGDCSKPARVQTCTAYRENEQCYTMFDDEGAPLLKGCLSDLDTSFIEPHTRYIFKCNENNCNTDANYPEPKSCYYCNSTTNAGCITNTGMLDAVVCDLLPYTNCFTKVFDDGRTERGCQSDLGIDEFTECLDPDSKTCQICSSNSCNSGVFPADRRSCLRCDSGKDADCETNPSGFGGLCPLYAPNQRCVVKVEGDRLVRGCDTEVFCDPNSSGCSYCEGDNCNTENLQVGSIGEPGKWQGLPLSCHKCDGAECLNGMVPPVSKCEGNNNQNCVVVFDANDKVTKRDCSDNVDAAYCAANPERCVSCKSNACNNYDIETVQQFVECYFCDSATNSDCAVNPSAISRTRKCKKCMTALYPRSSSNDTAYEISRSCLDDKEMDAQAECADGKTEYCQACSGPLCNGLTFPEDRLECYKCSGDCEDPRIEKCSAYAPDDQCFILVDTEENSIVLHGCRSDFEPEQVEGLIKQKQMILFDGNASNAPESLPTVKQCKICNSAEDPRCATNPNLVPSTTRCSNFPYTNCYTRVNDDGTTERGCLYSLSNDDFYQCLTGNNTLCSACDSNDCNAIDVFPANRLRCQQCDSATDPDCRLKPDSNIVCPLYDARDSCVTTLRDGEIVRGCSSNIQCDDPSDLTTCRTCNTNGCNTQILVGVDEDAGVPGRWTATPLTCHTCLGAEECAASLGGFRKCENNPLQNCVTVFDDNDVVLQRGCSDTIIPDYVGWCSDKKELCPRCNSNGCNTAKSLTEYIDCWACDVSKDPNCLYNLGALTKTRKCRESCMTAMYKREDEPNPAYVLARDCLDELDLDDREACEAGEFENCNACSTEKCNTATVPETRLSCYHCSGDGCQAPVARQCPFVRENDKCFIRFDERNEIVEQGCRSAYSNAEADYQLAKKYITYCDGDNCNTIDSLPPPQTCTLCNSRTDVNCAIDSESVQSVTTCNISPYTHCYSRVLSDGATERGCLQSLYDNEFLNCLDNQSGNCTVCLGARCNNKLFPETRLSCHTCDSVTDPTCERNPNSVTVCPKYQSDDQCVTSYANEITRRGCASNIDCDSTNPRGCVRCDGDGCNTVNLAIIQDDNYGKWQDLPLSCWTCDGAGCDALVKPERCENNNEQDCVSVFDATGKVIRRGCSDAVEATHGEWCAANKDNCPICKSNDCNQVTDKSQLVECLYCDSRKDSSCVSNPLTGKTRWCQGGCMTALYPTDGSTNPAYELIRTCLNDKEAEDRTECAEGKDAQCAACMTGKCNTAVVPADRRSCYTCNGANCENPQAQLCPVHKPNDKCFIWFDENNNVSEMGCVAKLGQQSLEDILKTKRVTVCDGDNCNVLEIPAPQRCAACNTTTDFNCAVNPTGISTFNTCNQLPYTHCYSRLSEDGNTGRGCLYDLPANQFAACLLGDDKNCGLCLGEGCNREIFPENRKRCFTCSSEDDDTCESDPTQTAVCPYERDSETCITALSGNVTIRGCSSLVYCDATQTQTCRSCTRSECNSIDLLNKVYDDYQGYWQDLPLRCHTCEDEQCDYSLGPALTCQGTVQQECMTVFNATGDVIRRGCEDDVESEFSKWCNTHKDHCYKCKSNECNDVWTRDDYVQCAYCLSSKDPLCATRPNSVFPQRHCNRDCLVAMRDGEIIRSCLDDKEVQDRYVCRGAVNSTECASCDSDNCNTFVYPSDRLSCHVCTGSSCSSSVPEYCSKYDKSDSCFAKYENGKLDLMGCVSGQNASDIEKWKAEKRLYECEGNNCNQLSLLPESSQCLSCDSSKNPNCAQNPMLVVQYETCAALSDECLTWLDTAGHTLRACVSSIPDDVVSSCTSAGSCAVCKGSRCNKDVFPPNRRKCHICATSQSDDKCVNAPESLAVCPIYAANDQCYSKKNSDDSVQRGCVSDASNCAGDECQKCNTDGCNTVDLTGSAALATASVVLTMLLASIAMLLSNAH